MINTQAEARRLRSMDEASTIGRLADDVVLALARRKSARDLSEDDRRALERTQQWLGQAVTRVTDPLSLSTKRLPGSSAADLDSFGPRLATAALEASPMPAQTDHGQEALETLRRQIRRVLDGQATPGELQQLHLVFEAVAQAMLHSSRVLRPTIRPAAWKTI